MKWGLQIEYKSKPNNVNWSISFPMKVYTLMFVFISVVLQYIWFSSLYSWNSHTFIGNDMLHVPLHTNTACICTKAEVLFP